MVVETNIYFDVRKWSIPVRLYHFERELFSSRRKQPQPKTLRVIPLWLVRAWATFCFNFGTLLFNLTLLLAGPLLTHPTAGVQLECQKLSLDTRRALVSSRRFCWSALASKPTVWPRPWVVEGVAPNMGCGATRPIWAIVTRASKYVHPRVSPKSRPTFMDSFLSFPSNFVVPGLGPK